MKWITFIILTYMVTVLQSTLGGLLTFSWGPVGTMGPDLAAMVAVFVAMNVRSGVDAATTGWVLGLAVDLTTVSAGGGATVVGPMAIAYAIGAAFIFNIREAFYSEKPLGQAVMAGMFCLVAHGIWVTAQAILAFGDISWAGYRQMLAEAIALAIYSAVLMPLGYLVLIRCRKWILSPQAGRRKQRFQDIRR